MPTYVFCTLELYIAWLYQKVFIKFQLDHVFFHLTYFINIISALKNLEVKTFKFVNPFKIYIWIVLKKNPD